MSEHQIKMEELRQRAIVLGFNIEKDMQLTAAIAILLDEIERLKDMDYDERNY